MRSVISPTISYEKDKTKGNMEEWTHEIWCWKIPYRRERFEGKDLCGKLKWK